MMHKIHCTHGCGSFYIYASIKDALRWKQSHRCARLPEIYRPKHLNTKGRTPTWHSTSRA